MGEWREGQEVRATGISPPVPAVGGEGCSQGTHFLPSWPLLDLRAPAEECPESPRCLRQPRVPRGLAGTPQRPFCRPLPPFSIVCNQNSIPSACWTGAGSGGRQDGGFVWINSLRHASLIWVSRRSVDA